MDAPMIDPTSTAPDAHGPVAGWIAPSPTPPRSGRQKTAILVVKLIAVLALFAAITAFLGGFVSTFLADHNAAATPLGSLFGEPYEQLPADFRVGIEGRLRKVAPADWDELSDAERSVWAREHVDLGLARLGDHTLGGLLRLRFASQEQAPIAVCAALIRETTNGRVLSRATDEALQLALSPDQRMERVEIHVEAIEAQIHGSPSTQTVSEAEAMRVRDEIDRLMTPEERRLTMATADGSFPSDSEICSSSSAFNAATLRLPADDFETIARWTYQPR